MRIGVVASSSGSVFQQIVRILRHTTPDRYGFAVATDRPCGIEGFCESEAIPHRRIDDLDNAVFSRSVRGFFQEQGGVDCVLLFFLRLVTEDLFKTYPTFNVHPSLLPAFRGFQPLGRALEAGVRFFGATLHLVDAGADTGPIVAQVISPLPAGATEAQLARRSFLQKVYLGLVLIELFERSDIEMLAANAGFDLAGDLPVGGQCNPDLRDPAWVDAFHDLQEREQVEAIELPGRASR